MQRSISSALVFGVVATAVLAGANSAQAAVIQFTDLASFQANTTITNIDFEGLTPANNYTYYPNPNGLNVSNVKFTDNANDLYVVGPAFNPALYTWGSGAVLYGGGRNITVTLPSGITAVGSDIMSAMNYASPFVITLSTGDTFNINSLNYPNRQFVGFTSDTAITSISFQSTNGEALLDNFRFGTANTTAVPEPFTVIGTLVGGTAALRLRKKLQSTGK